MTADTPETGAHLRSDERAGLHGVIPADTLDDLRWQSEHPAACVHMDKPTLRALLAAYERESSRMRHLFGEMGEGE